MSEIIRKTARKSSKNVWQRGEKKSAGIAATAALSGKSYLEAEAALPPATAERGANAMEVRRACMDLTGKRFRLRTYRGKPLVHEADLPKSPVVAALLRDLFPPWIYDQWVLLKNGRVYDPSEAGMSITFKEAGRRGLRVIVVVAAVGRTPVDG